MPYKDKEKNREYQKNWARKNKGRHKEYRNKKRIEAIEKLGGKCVYCGCNEYKALEINHIKGGGSKEHNDGRKIVLDIIYERIDIKEVELTCRVCNNWHYLKKIKEIKGNWKIKWIPSKTLNSSSP